MLEILKGIDTQLFRYLNWNLASPLMDSLMSVVTNRFTWIAVGTVFFIFAVFKRSFRLLRFCMVLGATLGVVDYVTYQVLKPTFARERPCRQLTDVHLVPEGCGGDFGFPSNHAANGMATAVVLGLTFGPGLGGVALAVTSLVGFSRVYIGVHFPGDVLAGFLVGAVLALCCYAAFGYLETQVRVRLRLRNEPPWG